MTAGIDQADDRKKPEEWTVVRRSRRTMVITAKRQTIKKERIIYTRSGNLGTRYLQGEKCKTNR